MTRFYKRCRWIGVGIWLTLFSVFSISTLHAQCDFVTDITGVAQGTPPTGDAANPLLFTHTFVLVDFSGNIYATNSTPDFLGVPAGLYNLYAVNYDNNESAAVVPLLAIGSPWDAVEAYGDNTANCADYTAAYGSGCPIVVCEEITVCEYETITNPSNTFEATDHTQTYCIVCAGTVAAVDVGANFDLSTIGPVVGGADCQLFAVNYRTVDGLTLTVGTAWSTIASAVCAGSCVDYIGLDMIINTTSQLSNNGVSTTLDWWDTSDGCAGAQGPVNAGGPFSETVNNWCIPSYNPAPIVAKPTASNPTVTNHSIDDLVQLMGGHDVFSRVPCVGTMDLTQNTVFYTVECDPTLPSTLQVDVTNPGGDITMIEAALYGPVTMPCPTITGGTFVDCDDAGAGSQSGEPIGGLTLTTSAGPGEVYLVIVDTEGKEEFTISTTILLATELVSFSGHKEEDDNVLEWTTSQEENLKHFELERSNDGVNFEKITDVLAIGNSKAQQDYSHVDEYPGVGTKYYRLKSVHQDGTTGYSHIVTLTRDKKEHFTNISIYPNPTKDKFFVEFASDLTGAVEYDIRDVIGQNAKKGELDIVAGMNKLELSLDNMPSATYIVSFTVEGQRIQRRIVKK
ncbi:MAG: T9SS type A sorting domain-containing protein [Aureispira sp.]|nr:T9SS type A sorting domain-containing protein [Aureispira sp.]